MSKTIKDILQNIEFEGKKLDVILNEDGEPLFELYSVGMALGYVNKRTNSTGKLYISPYKSRIDKTLKNAEIIGVDHDGQTYINIEDIRKMISLCHTENKIKFIEWLKFNGFITQTEVFNTTRKEINFLNKLEQSLKPFNITGIRQYSVLNYRIDYYIPSLNIAIEYDENGHSNYTYEQHELRQEQIENELGCKFIRVTDFKTNEYNIGLVIKEIFNIKLIA